MVMDTKQPFEKLVELHGATVLRVCRAVVGPVEAEDVWQETFLSALRAYCDRPAGANAEAWLVPIADLPEGQSRLGNPGPPGDGVWEHVALLPDKQRRVIAYRYLADLPFGEIAEIVGGTPAAARRAASDGLRKLRGLVAAASPKGDPHD